MDERADAGADGVRVAEVIGATCLATDLAMGFPFEHGLHATLVAMRLAELCGVDRDTAVQTFAMVLASGAAIVTGPQAALSLIVGGLAGITAVWAILLGVALARR